MLEQRIDEILEGLVERLADLEHERWAHWQRYMHSKGVRQPDGSLLLPADLVKHWEQQCSTRYSSLSEAEKDSDREQVQRYLPLLAEELKKNLKL